MPTLPNKNALADLSGGYYSYWTDGTTEGRATVAVLLASTDAQAAAASFSSLALGTDLAVSHGGTGASTAAAARTNLGVDAAGTDNSTDVTIAAGLDYISIAGQELTLGSVDLTTDVTGALPLANAAFADQNVLQASSPTFAGLTVDGGAGDAVIDFATTGGAGRDWKIFSNGSNLYFDLETNAGASWFFRAFDNSNALSLTTAGVMSVLNSVTIASDLTLASGSITSASGAISFGNENLTTTGTLTSGNHTISSGYLSISRSAPYIYFEESDRVDDNWRLLADGGVFYLSQMDDGEAFSAHVWSVDASGNHDFQAGNITTTGTASTGRLDLVNPFAIYDNRANNILQQSASTLATGRTIDFGNATYSTFNFNFAASATIDAGDANLTTTGEASVGSLTVSTNDGAGPGQIGFLSDFLILHGGANGLIVRDDQQNNNLVIDASGHFDFQSGNITTTGTFSSGAATVTGLTVSTGDVTLSAGDLVLGSNDMEIRHDGSHGQIDSITGRLDFYVGGTRYNVMDTSGNLILGATSTSNNAQFYATKTYSAASGTDIGAYFNYVQDTASVDGFRAVQGQARSTHTSGTLANLIGVYGFARASGAGGTTSNAYGLYSDVWSSDASSTITNAFGLYIVGFTATGTITNRWGIYQAGASESNYLAGHLRIGTTSATSYGEALHVSTVSGSTPAATFKGYESITSTTTANAGEIRVGENTSFQGKISYTGATTVMYITNTWNNGNGDVVLRTAGNTNTLVAKGYGSVQFLNGTVALPSIGFQNDVDTGLYMPSTGVIGAVTAGTERFRVASDAANLIIGGSVDPATMDSGLVLTTGTAPSAGAADAVALYSTDLSAGNTMLGIYTEGTPVGTGTPTQDRTIAVEVNGTTLYLLASTSAS